MDQDVIVTEVDLVLSHIVLDGDPAPPKKGTAPVFEHFFKMAAAAIPIFGRPFVKMLALSLYDKPVVYGLSSISMTCVQNGPLNCKNSSPEYTKSRYFETKN